MIRELGLARATTKSIARTAGLSEAIIFKHFKQKNDLLLAALQSEALVIAPKPESAGTEEVRDHLRRSARAALLYYGQIVPPIIASFADAALLSEYRRWIVQHRSEAQNVYDQAAGYVAEEQRLGRIRAECEASVIAEMLIGPCFRRAFCQVFLDSNGKLEDVRFISGLVEALEDAFVLPTAS